MSRLHNSIEPRVMDDEMLKLAVSEQGPREEAGQLAKQEGILFKDVLTLQLDFQSACPCPLVPPPGDGSSTLAPPPPPGTHCGPRHGCAEDAILSAVVM